MNLFGVDSNDFVGENRNVLLQSLKECSSQVQNPTLKIMSITNIAVAAPSSTSVSLSLVFGLAQQSRKSGVLLVWQTEFAIQDSGYSSPVLAYNASRTQVASQISRGTLAATLVSKSPRTFANITVGKVTFAKFTSSAPRSDAPTSSPTDAPAPDHHQLTLTEKFVFFSRHRFYVYIIGGFVCWCIPLGVLGVWWAQKSKGREDADETTSTSRNWWDSVELERTTSSSRRHGREKGQKVAKVNIDFQYNLQDSILTVHLPKNRLLRHKLRKSSPVLHDNLKKLLYKKKLVSQEELRMLKSMKKSISSENRDLESSVREMSKRPRNARRRVDKASPLSTSRKSKQPLSSSSQRDKPDNDGDQRPFVEHSLPLEFFYDSSGRFDDEEGQGQQQHDQHEQPRQQRQEQTFFEWFSAKNTSSKKRRDDKSVESFQRFDDTVDGGTRSRGSNAIDIYNSDFGDIEAQEPSRKYRVEHSTAFNRMATDRASVAPTASVGSVRSLAPVASVASKLRRSVNMMETRPFVNSSKNSLSPLVHNSRNHLDQDTIHLENIYTSWADDLPSFQKSDTTKRHAPPPWENSSLDNASRPSKGREDFLRNSGAVKALSPLLSPLRSPYLASAKASANAQRLLRLPQQRTEGDGQNGPIDVERASGSAWPKYEVVAVDEATLQAMRSALLT